ncbi:MAG TPA: hypothetical protein VIY49_01250 [Bryobacteraceae bacterium]
MHAVVLRYGMAHLQCDVLFHIGSLLDRGNRLECSWVDRGLPRFALALVASMTRPTIQVIRRATTNFIAAVNLVFWPVVAVFLTWKLCEWIWRALLK